MSGYNALEYIFVLYIYPLELFFFFFFFLFSFLFFILHRGVTIILYFGRFFGDLVSSFVLRPLKD